MLPAFKSIGAVATGVNPPGGAPNVFSGTVSEADVAFLVTCARSGFLTSVGSGWTSIAQETSSSCFFQLWWRRVTAADAGQVSATITGATSGVVKSYIIAYSNCLVSGNPYEAVSSGTSGASAILSTNAITTPAANELVVDIGGIPGGNTQTLTNFSNPGLTNYTNRINDTFNLVSDGVQLTAGAVASAQAAINPARNWASFRLALIPQPANTAAIGAVVKMAKSSAAITLSVGLALAIAAGLSHCQLDATPHADAALNAFQRAAVARLTSSGANASSVVSPTPGSVSRLGAAQHTPLVVVGTGNPSVTRATGAANVAANAATAGAGSRTVVTCETLGTGVLKSVAWHAKTHFRIAPPGGIDVNQAAPPVVFRFSLPTVSPVHLVGVASPVVMRAAMPILPGYPIDPCLLVRAPQRPFYVAAAQRPFYVAAPLRPFYVARTCSMSCVPMFTGPLDPREKLVVLTFDATPDLNPGETLAALSGATQVSLVTGFGSDADVGLTGGVINGAQVVVPMPPPVGSITIQPDCCFQVKVSIADGAQSINGSTFELTQLVQTSLGRTLALKGQLQVVGDYGAEDSE